MNNLVSIITPLYNSEKFILSTINSVLQQTYCNWEMIIVDDFSTDKGIDLITSVITTSNSKIKLIKLKENLGVAQARNSALDVANGRFIAFLDSDDIWHPEKLDSQVSFMLRKNIPISFTSYRLIDENENSKNHVINSIEKVDYMGYLKNTIIGFSTSMIDTKHTGNDFRFSNMRSREDTDLWIRLLSNGHTAHGIPDVLVDYRIHSNSITVNKFHSSIQVWDLYFNKHALGLFKATYCFLFYIFNTIKKRM